MGKVFKYGDDVNTDVLFPGKYTYTAMEPAEMAQHALEDLDPQFFKRVQPGDIIVAGKNFGCGSSREQAVLAPKYAGVAAVIAVSFARIFYRNCINLALPAISCPEAAQVARAGSDISVDAAAGKVTVDGSEFAAGAVPPFMLEMLERGGLIPWAQHRLAQSRS